MTKQSSIIITGLAGEACPLVEIREAFNNLAIGGNLLLKVPHRDMWFHKTPRLDDQNKCWYLPQNCEPPHTFSFEDVIKEALNVLCPEAPKDLETLSAETQAALAEVAEGQGFWQFKAFRIEENSIMAVITKL